MINLLLDRYALLLEEVDTWFQGCIKRYPDSIRCVGGCSECCRGLFDITLLDAFFLKRGFDSLSKQLKDELSVKAAEILEQLSAVNSRFAEPWILNSIPEDDWDALMPEDDDSPCILLSETGRCLLYNHRPMTCRLNGIPLIDISGEDFFDEYCSLNFTDVDPRRFVELRYSFRDLFSRELTVFQEFVAALVGHPANEVDLFIPGALLLDVNKITDKVRSLKK